MGGEHMRATRESHLGSPASAPAQACVAWGDAHPTRLPTPIPSCSLQGHLLPWGTLQVCWEPQADHRRCQAGLQAQLHCDLGEPLPWVPWHPLSRTPFLPAPLTLFPVPVSWPHTGCSRGGFSCPNWENRARGMVSAGLEAWRFFFCPRDISGLTKQPPSLP